MESKLLMSTGTHSDSSQMPPFPGAQYSWDTREDWRNFHTKACSRPPLPMTRTFMRTNKGIGQRMKMSNPYQSCDHQFRQPLSLAGIAIAILIRWSVRSARSYY